MQQQQKVIPIDQDEVFLAQRAAYDQQAFAELYRRYVERVYRYLLARVGQAEDAQDLTSQTFLLALKSIGTYQPARGTFIAWLMGIAQHRIAEHYRRYQNVVGLDAAADMVQPGLAVEETVSQQLQIEAVRHAMQFIAPDRAEALRLHIFGELSAAEIAQVMGRNEPAVRMLIHRALQDLRQRMKGDER